MEKTVHNISDCENEIEVELEYSEIQTEIDEAYKKQRKTISHPGFRKGKMPMGMLKKLHGEAIEYKASEDIANKKFWDIVKDDDLKPISTPQLTDLNFDPGKKLGFKVKYEIMPTLDIKDYKKLEIEKPVFKVRDEDIEKEVEHLMISHATFELAEEVTDEKCKITTNMRRLDENDVVIVGSVSENLEIDLGDPNVNPQIANNAKGKKTGETFRFKFSNEHKHGEETHAEEFNYEAEITKIQKRIYPEITDEFVKKISSNKASSLDELKNQIRDNFEKYFTEQSENIFTNSMLNKIVEENEFTAPPGYVESLHKRMFEYEKQNAEKAKNKNFDEAAVSEQLKPRSEQSAKWQIILDNIARVEGITVSDSDLEEVAKKEAAQYGLPVEKIMEFYKSQNRGETILEEKVMKHLKENIIIKEVDPMEKAKETKKPAAKAKKKPAAKKTTKKKEEKEKS